MAIDPGRMVGRFSRMVNQGIGWRSTAACADPVRRWWMDVDPDDFQSIFKNHSIGRLRLAFSHDDRDAPALVGDWQYAGPFAVDSVDALRDASFPPEESRRSAETAWTSKPDFVDAVVHGFEPTAPAAHYLKRTIESPTDRTITVSLGSDDGLDVLLNGERVHASDTPRGAAPDQDEVELALQAGANELLLLRIDNYVRASGFYYRLKDESFAGAPPAISGILSTAPEARTDEQRLTLQGHWARTAWPPGIEAGRVLDAAETERAELMEEVPTTYVSQELEMPRTTTMLIRGQYDQPGEPVSAGTLAFLPPMDETLPARTRLGLARWLVDPAHPLTARVTVNRIWQQYFGTGLVETTEDFGLQGSQPSHPELLDWLAVWFIEQDWNLQALHRLIVTSDTYKQSSQTSSALRVRDPDNRLLARFPRHRLMRKWSATRRCLHRDCSSTGWGRGRSSLSAAGVVGRRLATRAAIRWTSRRIPMTACGDAVCTHSGNAPVRPPSMTLLDAPSREFSAPSAESGPTRRWPRCCCWNDEQYVEAARGVAQRAMLEGGGADAARAEFMFRLVTSRRPSAEELDVLLSLYLEQRTEFASDPEAALALLGVGCSPRDESLDPASHAAWTMVANLVLNLDETISKGWTDGSSSPLPTSADSAAVLLSLLRDGGRSRRAGWVGVGAAGCRCGGGGGDRGGFDGWSRSARGTALRPRPNASSLFFMSGAPYDRNLRLQAGPAAVFRCGSPSPRCSRGSG